MPTNGFAPERDPELTLSRPELTLSASELTTEARAWLDSLAARLLWAEIVRTDDEQ